MDLNHEFKSNVDILLKLSLYANLTINKRDPSLEVNGSVFYYLLPENTVGRAMFQVKRSIFGTVISVPSMYPQRYFYDRTTYVDGPWRR